MMALIGEFERGTIPQNIKMGMLARARDGRWCGNKVLGYDIVEIPTLQKKRKETKQGNNFLVESIKDILMNPVYIGKIRYNVRQDWAEKRRKNINPNPILVEGIHDAIIAESMWDRVQKILESKSGKPSRIYDGEYPLTGILKCPVCGARMVIARTTNTLKDGTKKRIAYYVCGNWKNKGTAVCHSNSIRVDSANDYVFKRIEELLTNDKMVKDIIKNVNTVRRNGVEPKQKKLDKS